MKKIKENKGITLVALIITIIMLLIVAGVTINAINNTNLIAKSESVVETSKKKTAQEIINLKITNIQISNYVEKQKMPTLQELADGLCEDDEMEYVLTASKNVASLGKLDKIQVGEASSIFTKLKAYPYEFEINSSLQLASIDGVKIATTPTATLTDEMKKYIDERIDYKLAAYKEGTITQASTIKGLKVRSFKYDSNSASMRLDVELSESLASGKSVVIGNVDQSDAKPKVLSRGICFLGNKPFAIDVDTNGEIRVRNLSTVTVSPSDFGTGGSLSLSIYYSTKF